MAMDTQRVLGGRSIELSEEDYVVAAIFLYVDIMYTFYLLLQAFGKSKDGDGGK